MLFEGRPAAWTFRVNVVIDWRRIVVGLLSGCSLKDSREDDQNQTDIFRVRSVRYTQLTLATTSLIRVTPARHWNVKQLPGIAADNPSLWNQWHEPLIDVVCTPVRCFKRTWRMRNNFGWEEGLKDMDE
jgi:hypothetical protein